MCAFRAHVARMLVRKLTSDNLRRNACKGQYPLHQFPRCKSATSPQQVDNFSAYGRITGKHVYSSWSIVHWHLFQLLRLYCDVWLTVSASPRRTAYLTHFGLFGGGKCSLVRACGRPWPTGTHLSVHWSAQLEHTAADWHICGCVAVQTTG